MVHSDRIKRFLKSINIENIEDFDLDFVSITKSKVDNNVFVYVFKKYSPWEARCLDEFLSGLNSITTYKADVSFIYDSDIKIEDVIEIVDSKYFNEFYSTFNIDYKVDGLKIFVNVSEEKVSFFENINSLLAYISYPYRFVINVIEEKQTEEIEEQKVEVIDKQYEENKELIENQLAKEIEDNYKQMIEERRRKDLYKKGDYQNFAIKDIDENSGAVDINGKVFEITTKISKKGFSINKILIADNDGAIYVNYIFKAGSPKEDVVKNISYGKNIRVVGKVDFDSFSKTVIIAAHNVFILPDDALRDDNALEKRVELHLHTNMSEMDGINEMKDYVNLAKHFGHKAIAVTDHGVVQSFPDAQYASKKTGIKILYGCELYVIEDKFKAVINPSDAIIEKTPIVIFDLESTGLNIRYDKITEIGAVKYINGMIVDRFDMLVNPLRHIPSLIQEKTNITDELVKNEPSIKDVLPAFLKFIDGCILVSHNIEFDYYLLNEEMVNFGFGKLTNSAIDTLQISRFINPENARHSLGALCRRYDVDYDEEHAHRADYDAQVLSNVFIVLKNKLNEIFHKEITLNDIKELPIPNEYLKHWARGGVHTTVLCKNKAGLKDLYKIVSYSHTEHMGSHPFCPRSLLNEHRSNLLVGSGCANGEVFYASLRRNEEAIKQAVDYYDFIEVQPLENLIYLVNSNEVNNIDMLKQIVMDYVNIARNKNKLICATGDVHYLNKEQKKYRDIYIESTGVGNTLHPLRHYNKDNPSLYYENPDQHFRTTEEMLDCFKWMGDEFAYEIVVTNTNKVADMCENFDPIPNKLFTPTIENCDNMLRDLCYSTAHELYGENLPELIATRLKKELDGIINSGYAVTYYIAYKLVKLTNDAGYFVGSRGSVGSSFAATMAKITEVNPLPPHYRCPKCKHVEFFNGNGKYKSGFDLPLKKCPVCGEIMVSDGQDIPFETFLGFHADKVPDIDLNFPRDFQSTAHLFTKDLLGADKVYRAGTISTVQFKTAFGYVKKYFELFNLHPSNAWVSALSYGCVGVKRTTGQHPGGIVVIPKDYDVYDFCPVQYPAGDDEATWQTTHFDFDKIHDLLLKLDMLGHVDPQAIRFLLKLTNVNLNDIPFNDPKVLSLFSTDKALNMQHKYMKEDNGAIGLPEFGTEITRQVLRETQPKSFNDLLIISGLTHGTNVYGNNQQNLINDGICTLQEVIGCRDDIMTYLISKGLPNLESFTIMELVRKKDKHLTPELIELMRQHDVPEYYIEACNKIEYLFPRGHACAYVMMALRVGYFKVYYPLEFYASYFSLRADDFDIVAMIGGIDAIHARLSELQHKKIANNVNDKFSKKDGDILNCLIVALEMAERGFIFENIDLEKSDSHDFIVDHKNNALIPPFRVVPGLGIAAGDSVLKARNEGGQFTSKDDLTKRTSLSQTNIKDLEKLGVLKNLKEDDEISLFDLDF